MHEFAQTFVGLVTSVAAAFGPHIPSLAGADAAEARTV